MKTQVLWGALPALILGLTACLNGTATCAQDVDCGSSDFVCDNGVCRQKSTGEERPIVENEPAREESIGADESPGVVDTSDGSMSDETRADEPTADEPTADEPTADEPTADEPAADEPGVESDASGDFESTPEVDPCAEITCNDHGWCSRGGCICDPGYAGSGCTSCQSPDRYVIDGLGNDTFYDQSGYDEARCVPGLTITGDTMSGSNRILTLSNGNTVTIEGNGIEALLGCN